MSSFPGMILTAAGLQLQAKAQTGQPLVFLRVEIGDGELPADPELAEALTSKRGELMIQDHVVVGDGTSRLRVVMTNEGVAEGFFVREIGVVARDPDTLAEVLYSYSNAGDLADFMPAAGGPTLFEQVFDLYTVIGTATNVTAVINDYITIATKADIEEIRPYLLPHGGLPGQLLRKVSSTEGHTEWFNPEDGMDVRVSSVEESRIAVADQTVFNLALTRVSGLAVYVEGVRLRRDEWEAVSDTQVVLDSPLPAGTQVTFVNNEEAGALSLTGISVTGDTTINPGQTKNYTITDYDSFALYSVSASAGTVTRSGATITLEIAPGETATSTTITVHRDGSVRNILVGIGSEFANAPEIIVPAPGATGVETTGPLTTGEFLTTPLHADTHLNTDWQVSTVADFATTVWQSLADAANKISIAVPAGELSPLTTYYVRARHRGAVLGESAWSAARQFTTRSAMTIAKPDITSPPVAALGFDRSGPLTTSAFAAVGGVDTHASTDWQVSTDSGFSAVVHQSLGNASDLVSYALPTGALNAGTLYYARARHRGATAGASPWSDAVAFTTLKTNKPTITNPDNGDTGVLVTGPFASSAFDSTGTDTHASTDWQFSTVSNFSTVAHESLNNASALTSYAPSVGALGYGQSYYVRCRHNGTNGGASQWSDAVSFQTAAAAGELVYTTAGTFNLIVPTGVFSISAVGIGGGGRGSDIKWGGGGGALAYRNNVAVTPGESLTVEVGAGGDSSTLSGGTTRIKRGPTVLLEARGGNEGYNLGVGGTISVGATADGGGNGGSAIAGANTYGTGGGGAGGYSGNGGNGGSSTAAATAGSGGGGGGGARNTSATATQFGGGGGGTGLYGVGLNGAAGVTSGQAGGGGSGGGAGIDGTAGLTGRGGQYGGGGGCRAAYGTYPSNGQGGAVRVVWPGASRAFPSTGVA